MEQTRMKAIELIQYSNPVIAQHQAFKYLGREAVLHISTKPTKKYMIRSPEGKWIHFGQMGAEDFTYHQDEARRQAFRTRNRKWAKADKWTPAYMAYYILW